MENMITHTRNMNEDSAVLNSLAEHSVDTQDIAQESLIVAIVSRYSAVRG